MEHIERAGVHSGDSMAIYPCQNLSQAVQKQIVQYTQELAQSLNCIGMMNIQFIIHNEQTYVIEVNPRASRTVPFLSKVTAIPMAQVATKAMLGNSLKDQGYSAGLQPVGKMIHVKAPVFSFSKLTQVDSLLGPEMKSTGEVMGSDYTLPKALYKAFEATKIHLPHHGTILITVKDEDKKEAIQLAQRFHELGFQLIATMGTAQILQTAGLKVKSVDKLAQNSNLLDLITQHQVQLVINTISHAQDSAADGVLIRQTAIAHDVPLFTSLDTVSAILQVLEAQSFVTQAL